MAILDQRSFLTGRIGTKLFGDNITIWDDVAHPLQTGSPFDGEGMQTAEGGSRGKWSREAGRLRAGDGGKNEAFGTQEIKLAPSLPPATVSHCRTKWVRCR